MKRFILYLLFIGMSAAPSAWAWDGVTSFVPGSIEVTEGPNYGFRVTGPPMCGNANGWAYLLSTDSNYSTYVAVILMAKAQGLSVTFFTNRDSTGYCHIQYLIQS